MAEFAGTNSLNSPLIAVLTSDSVDELFKKNNLNFADMLAPFSAVNIHIRDPTGNQINTRINLDIRDIRKSGFLLSHTVLPHVLRENVVDSFSPKSSENVFWTFFSSFFYWFEPTNYDFLHSYLCCIFIVSVDETDPVEQLNKLQCQQHIQQHGQIDSSSSTLTLAHCSPPKWMLPNILKYIVVVQDVLQHSDDKANEVFSNVKKKYGSACHLLRINSTTNSQLPDPWANTLERRYRGLNAGLDRARRDILEKSNVEVAQETDNGNQYIVSAQMSRSSTASSFSMISGANGSSGNVVPAPQQPQSSLFTTSLTIPQILPSFRTKQSVSPQNVPTMINGFIPTTLPSEGTNSGSLNFTQPVVVQMSHGQCLDTGDRERLRLFVDEFTRNALVPFVEHQLSQQKETLDNRRTIGRSFTSMRKWLSGAASSATSTSNTNVSYGVESSEWHMRCQADLAFQFGLYYFANQQYQTLKKDFANDQAWLHHAGALEMAAVTSFLGYVNTSVQADTNNGMTFSSTTMALLQKNYPQRYMDNAINYYLNVCMQPLLALRCVLLSVMVLIRLEMYTEAASHLILMNTLNFPDLYAGILLEQAGHLLNMAKKRHRMAFYDMLAGHRYLKAALPQFALICYRRVLPILNPERSVNTGLKLNEWSFAEDHILYTLTAQHENLLLLDGEAAGARFVVECAARLLRPRGKQCIDQQRVFLTNYVNLSRRYHMFVQPAQFRIPHVDMQSIRVFYGDSFGSARFIRSTTFVPLNASNRNRMSFNSVIPEGFRPDEGFYELELEICHLLLVWEELENATVAYHNSRVLSEESGADSRPLFSDECTDNAQSEWKATPIYEPITVQLTLKNPLSISLTLKNLRLGVSISNVTGDISSSLNYERIEKIVLPPSSNAYVGGRESPKSVESLTFAKSQPNSDENNDQGTSVINLTVTPTQPIDIIFERLEFELCASLSTDSRLTSPHNIEIVNNTSEGIGDETVAISGYIPLAVKGKRLFATKKQRRTPTYSADNRLRVRVVDKCWPLLDFRLAGSAPNTTCNRMLGCHRVNAYCNQIYQVLIDVENIGRVPVTRLYLATDRVGLVSLSEERIVTDGSEPQSSKTSPGKWQLCASYWMPCSSTLTAANGSKGLLIHELSVNINPRRPLALGGKLTLRLAFRAPSTPNSDHQISVLFAYLNATGAMRQFRYRLAFSTQMLLGASLRALNPQDGLCALFLKNRISARDSVLVRIELQRFSTILLTLNDVPTNERTSKYKGVRPPFKISNTLPLSSSKLDVGIGIKPIFKNPVVLESEQSQHYCFFLTANNESGTLLKELWMSDFIADIPEWSHLLPVNAFLPFLAEGVSSKLHEYRIDASGVALDSANLNSEMSGLTMDEKTNSLFHLRLAVLWKAYITNSDGTVATVFGENILPNPFAAPAASVLCRIPYSPYMFIVANEEQASTAAGNNDLFRTRSAQSNSEQQRSASAADDAASVTGSPPSLRNPFTTPSLTADTRLGIELRSGSISRLASKF